MASRPPSRPTADRRGCACGRGGDQGLDLAQDGARAFDAGEDDRAGRRLLAPGKEQGRGVGDLGKPPARHLEDADLVRRAEAVLDRAQDAELVAALALEVEDRVDHVLDHAGAGDLAVLGDVSHQIDADPAPLGEGGELVRRRAHLRDRAGRAVDGVEPHGLDRIDDRKARAFGLERGEDVAQVRLRRQPHRRVAQSKALGAHADLRGRLLARDVDRGQARAARSFAAA